MVRVTWYYLILVYTVHSMACYAHIIRVTSPNPFLVPESPPSPLKVVPKWLNLYLEESCTFCYSMPPCRSVPLQFSRCLHCIRATSPKSQSPSPGAPTPKSLKSRPYMAESFWNKMFLKWLCWFGCKWVVCLGTSEALPIRDIHHFILTRPQPGSNAFGWITHSYLWHPTNL